MKNTSMEIKKKYICDVPLSCPNVSEVFIFQKYIEKWISGEYWITNGGSIAFYLHKLIHMDNHGELSNIVADYFMLSNYIDHIIQFYGIYTRVVLVVRVFSFCHNLLP